MAKTPQPGLFFPLIATKKLKDENFDCLLLVIDKLDGLPAYLQGIKSEIENYQKIDKSAEKEAALIVTDLAPGRRLIYSPTGPVNRDQDDVRRFADAGAKGIKRALEAGCRAPLVIKLRQQEYPAQFPLASRVIVLGMLQVLYTPLEVREAKPEKATKVDKLGIFAEDESEADFLVLNLHALEAGRIACRDIGGSDPERMAAPRVAEYVTELFKDTCVKVTVKSDLQALEKDYPLLAAVNRASKNVERHAPRVLFLEYEGESPIDMTVLLVGKGITYDTGGADVKVGGAMLGMCRDKCGAASVAGFFKTLSIYKPKGLKVIGAMSMVRNSIGSNSYVSDEILTSRAGKRVRVNNTDAEGRMVMADVLCEMKERAVNEINPIIFTIATLTGHVIKAYSEHYSCIIGNKPAREAVTRVSNAGELSGDLFEISKLRREDFEAHHGKSEYEDLMQAAPGPSTMKERGHQSPAAFLIMASGLDEHGGDSSKPLAYCHLDIAGSAGLPPHAPKAAPIVALSHTFALNRECGAIICEPHLH